MAASPFLPPYTPFAWTPLPESHTRVVQDDAATPAGRYAAFNAEDEAAVAAFAQAMKQLVVTMIPAGLGPQVWQLASRAANRARARGLETPGLYYRESDHWAALAGLTPGELALLQRMYSFARAGGCSTTCYWDDAAQEMVCLRSLDWNHPLAIARATRCFEHRTAQGLSHYAVGPLGMLGELTVVRPGAFSVVINWAAGGVWQTLRWACGARPAVDPLFALRALAESPVDSYAGAVRFLQQHPVAAPVFFTVCGRERGQACVVERGPCATLVRELGDAPCLVQTNHYDPARGNARANVASWDTDDTDDAATWYASALPTNSGKRRRLLEAHWRSGGEPWAAYREAPVWNAESAYWVEMRPARTGRDSVQVWVRP